MKKRFLASVLCASMVLGTTVAWAEEPEKSGTSTGTGAVEGIVEEKSIWSVTLPTEVGTVFNFKLDPQGLIVKTSQAAYGESATFESGKSLFFTTAADTYKSYSQALTVTNKSSFDVNISVSAEASAFDGITLVDELTVKEEKDGKDEPSMMLALVKQKGASQAVGTDIAEEGAVSYFDVNGAAKLEGIIAGTPSNFELIYDKTGETPKYVYKEKSTTEDTSWKSYTFYMMGEINTLADAEGWAKLADAAPTVGVTWTVEDASAPAYKPTSTAVDSSDGTKYVLAPTTPATSVSSVKVFSFSEYAENGTSGTAIGTVASTNYSLSSSSGKILITKTAVSALTKSEGDYIVEVKTNNATYTFKVTKE